MGPFGAPDTTPKAEVSPRKVRLQGFSTKKRGRDSLRCGPTPPRKTLLLGSSAEIGPRGAPRTPGDDVRVALSSAVNLTPRLPPDAAGRSVPESLRRACGARPLPPTGR